MTISYKPKPNLQVIVATRTYEFQGRRGAIDKVVLKIAKPVRLKFGQGDWSCSFRVRAFGKSETLTACGIDSIQAFVLALRMAESVIRYNEHTNAGKILWLGQSDLGLSLARTG